MRWIPRLPELEKLDTYQMLPRLQIVSGFGVILIFLYSLQYWRSPSAVLLVLGIGVIEAGASHVAGFLMGLIFGIPRTPARQPSAQGASTLATAAAGPAVPASTPGPSTVNDVEPNTNLVEISDWLTKILVGVGLVELGKIPLKMQHLASFFAMGLRHCPPGTTVNDACFQSSEALAMVIIIFFSVSGFLLGYLWARLYLQRALSEINSVKLEVSEAKASIFVALSRVFTGLGTWQDPQPRQIGSVYYKRALRYLDRGLSKYPADPELHFEMAIVLKSYAMSQQPRNLEMIGRALAHVVECSRLNPSDPIAVFNMACYQALLGKDITLIVQSLERAFALRPELRAEAWADDDLVSVRNSPEFRNVAGPPPNQPNQPNQPAQPNQPD
jgi:hypothetical protein